MELDRKQMALACAFAQKLVEKRTEDFKPAKTVLKDSTGSVRALTFCGSSETELMCEVLLKWFYRSYGATDRVPVPVHVRLAVYLDSQGKRRLRFVEMHAADWEQTREKTWCKTCGEGFTLREAIVNDTDGWEY
jgi:hypothetical protein